jgi:O-antigen/teichoic acid export membrane protein
VWLSGDTGEAAGLIVVALAYVLVTGPLQVGSNLLVGTGHARAVLWPALAAVIVNLGLSIVLVHHVGIVGAFMASLIASPLLVVPLLRAALARVELRRAEFIRASLRPLLVPTIALVGVVAAVTSASFTELETLVVAAVLGFAAYVASAYACSLDEEEREIMRTAVLKLRRRRSK